MTEKKAPGKHYHYLKSNFSEVMEAVENLGSTVREAGPLDKKTTELIQLAVAASVPVGRGSSFAHQKSPGRRSQPQRSRACTAGADLHHWLSEGSGGPVLDPGRGRLSLGPGL